MVARRPRAGRRSCRWAAGPLGRWAAGPLGRWAAGPLGRWAAGPLGRWAAGPLGRWAAGPLGRWAAGPLGRWAAGPESVARLPREVKSVSTSVTPSPSRPQSAGRARLGFSKAKPLRKLSARNRPASPTWDRRAPGLHNFRTTRTVVRRNPSCARIPYELRATQCGNEKTAANPIAAPESPRPNRGCPPRPAFLGASPPVHGAAFSLGTVAITAPAGRCAAARAHAAWPQPRKVPLPRAPLGHQLPSRNTRRVGRMSVRRRRTEPERRSNWKFSRLQVSPGTDGPTHPHLPGARAPPPNGH